MAYLGKWIQAFLNKLISKRIGKRWWHDNALITENQQKLF